MTHAHLKPNLFCGGEARVTAAAFGEDGFVVGCIHTNAADPQGHGISPQNAPYISREAAIEA